MKDTQINLRLSEKDLTLIKQTAEKYGLTVTKFILSVVIPHCLRGSGNIENK